MSTLLELLARATDTKGYPDDKDPNHWRKIHGSPVHLDANGNIDGGAGGKFGGRAWTSTNHPHNPASYPQPTPAPAPQPPPQPAPPPVTTNDLKQAWAKVAQCFVAMKRAKTQATFLKQQHNMINAITGYANLRQKATPQVANSFNPNVARAVTNATMSFAQIQANQQAAAAIKAPAQQPAPQANGTPLTNLAQASAPNGLQSGAGNANINKGRNVKIYNLSLKGVHALQSFIRNHGLNIPSNIFNSNDANTLGKAVSQELTRLNNNYLKMTLSAVQKLTTPALLKKLKAQNTSNLNPTLENSFMTLRLSMALGNNNPPKVVSAGEFQRLAKNSPYPVLYRGVGGAGAFDAKTIANDFKYGDTTWLGGSACNWGVGLYSSTSQSYASAYGSEVIQFLPDPQKVKIIEWDDLCDEAKRRGILKTCDYSGGGHTRDADEMTVLALQLGYNMVKVNGGNSHYKGMASQINSSQGDFYVALDRGCLIAKK